ncbi:DoxX family protein [Amycolatopsis acidiphila]|uniref:DoxX family protein n=1 Tax=Amycolatopsis acidiphila TaxID=715473 RepID=A0A558AIK4_9PSEU|nr:DoxX family protein [Amycolatopsis acidiphila]TVT24103.1 DoxX family protein [Amycolatopsis acidiphila]UIJ57740.1 DoxX family protein [Amycolatopsis acidiphila]GHG87409.1 hypothetical protein GCM10017788_61000 [Amycolatopsis acidiphila]
MHTFIHVLSLVLAAVFLVSGLVKLIGVEAIEVAAEAIGVPRRLHKTAGVLEIAAAAALVADLWWPPLGIAAAIGLTIMMVLATSYHLRGKDKPANTAVPALLGLFTLTMTILSLTTNI